MDAATQTHLNNLYATDRALQNEAYDALMRATETPVDWAYDAWDDLVTALQHEDNHVRAIAAQVLANLANSDPDDRMARDFDTLLNVTRDERFVTARHALQSLWKLGLPGESQRQRLLDGLTRRFGDCASEKNCTLIRYDIAVGLRTLYDATGDDVVKTTALNLIDTEDDPKYRKKYAAAWRGA